jgi:HEAT repeat protein
LLRLLDDPQLNVQTMALEGLAQRRDRFAANQILRRLKNSQDWYFQIYAYRALRALGWNQTVPR